MPIREKCLLCGLDLLWIPNDSKEKGSYLHLFTHENAHLYKSIHSPVPCIPDLPADLPVPRASRFSGGVLDDEQAFNSRGKVESRATETEKRDVQMVAHVLAAIFQAR